MDDNDVFARAGGSLLNDLLSDLDAAVAASSFVTGPDEANDDILASLERELATSYASAPEPASTPLLPVGSSSTSVAPPGMGSLEGVGFSAAAFVVGHQSRRATQMPPFSSPTAGSDLGGSGSDDAWSAALSQFGGMSLAADFLAADTAKKEKEAKGSAREGEAGTLDSVGGGDLTGGLTSDVVGKLFEDDDEYDAEEEVVLLGNVVQTNVGVQGEGESQNISTGVDMTGGLMALLEASKRNDASPSKQDTPLKVKKIAVAADTDKVQIDDSSVPKDDAHNQVVSPKPTGPGTEAPPPSPMFSPHPMGYPMPPGGFPGSGGMPPHPHPMMLNPGIVPPMHPTMAMGRGIPPLPPNAMHPMMMSSQGYPIQGPPGGPPFRASHHGSSEVPTTAPRVSNQTPTQIFDKKDFPTLGSSPQEDEEKEDDSEETKEPVVEESPMINRIIFNNPNTSAQPIPASIVASTLMPSRDLCYIVHSMLRPLQSLDTYNDDYYHWSFNDRKSRNILMLGGMGQHNMKALPNPVWKEVKVMAKEREEKYREAVESRAKDWSEEKKILGRTVKTNVKRPKALLNTPVLHKEIAPGEGLENSEDMSNLTDTDYEKEQHRNRVLMWRARVAIDKGYTAFLSLTELRRLIQAHAGAPQMVNDLMNDVKSNVDLLHASFGIIVKVDSDGHRKIDVDKTRLGSTLSLPKGRVLCARVIEGGILPHQSACEMLPVAIFCIYSNVFPDSKDGAMPSLIAGEDRLLRALTSLVLTVQPSVEPMILCRCLDMAVLAGKSDVDAESPSGNVSNITGSRTRMELLHSILSRGKAVCNDSLSGVWTEKENSFLTLLSQQGSSD